MSLPVAFALFGVLWGGWQAVLPDLAAAYELSSGPLGAILTAGFAASLPLMLVAGRALDRFGAGRVVAVSAFGMALALGAVALLPPLVGLGAAVIVFASGSGGYDVAINGAAVADREWSQPARLTLLHAAFSGGGAAGAIAAGALIGAGVSPSYVYAALAWMLVAVALLSRGRRSATASGGGGAVPSAIARAMLPLAALAALAFLAEGSMETWSAIYLRDELGAAAFVGALGPGAFHAAMLSGRLVGAGVAGRLGAAATLLVGGSLSVAGMAVALVVAEPAVAIPGLAVAALGASFVVPVVMSLAAGRAGAHAGRATSYVLSLGYAGFLIGPSLVGVLGEVAGLRVALVVVPVATAIIALASRTRVSRGA
jgi:MFS family permease